MIVSAPGDQVITSVQKRGPEAAKRDRPQVSGGAMAPSAELSMVVSRSNWIYFTVKHAIPFDGASCVASSR
ncbi:hypothetical protein NKH99_24835 [Mesorhizobium sp. M0854]|uniref:hypothetical protein n=1 Tax=Mesorhizobium sp. M0854 TaxID=2957013 RepID=UPI00333AC824